MKMSIIAFIVVTTTLAAACDSPPPAPVTPSGAAAAQPVSVHDVALITKERCEREERCTNVGVGRRYATREVCDEQIRSDNMNNLTNAACPYGINAANLQTCLADIRAEACGNPFDSLNRYIHCTVNALCPH